jgi:putative flippase GtrA
MPIYTIRDGKNTIFQNMISRQFIKWGIIGFFTFLIDLLGLILLESYIDFSIFFLNIISGTLASIFNYTLHRLWTFGSSKKLVKSLIYYILTSIFSLLLNSTFVLLFFYSFNNITYSKLLATTISALATYILLKKIVF